MTTQPEGSDEVLFAESGASWYWVLTGPLAALMMLVVQFNSGLGLQLTVPLTFLVLVSGFVALQIKAGRIHTSVELTRNTLRQGAETILVDEILVVYPEPRHRARGYVGRRTVRKNNALTERALRRAGIEGADAEQNAHSVDDDDGAIVEKWQSARALGELTGVPRGRTGIGLEITDGRTVQAWARRHRDLRAALAALVDERRGPQPGSIA